MNIYFRTDASIDIGTGHVMRCLTLAEALRDKGANCRFVCRAHPGNLLDLISHRGFEVQALPTEQFAHSPSPLEEYPGVGDLTYADWLGADWATDAAQTIVGIGDAKADYLIVDHYAIDVRWERKLRPACHRLMVIDDLADRAHDCDLLLDQNLGRVKADYADLVLPDCTVLCGPKFALLRPEFAALRDYSFARRAQPEVKHLLINMGGVDRYDATGNVLEAIRVFPLPVDCRITVVMGPHAPWLEQVRGKAALVPWATEVLVNVEDMANLMAGSDIAIGAAGTSAWERCCLGLPTLTMVLAENQRAGASALERIGAVLLLEHRDQDVTELHEKLSVLLEPKKLRSMQQACRMVTDGGGAARLVTRLSNTNG